MDFLNLEKCSHPSQSCSESLCDSSAMEEDKDKMCDIPLNKKNSYNKKLNTDKLILMRSRSKQHP